MNYALPVYKLRCSTMNRLQWQKAVELGERASNQRVIPCLLGLDFASLVYLFVFFYGMSLWKGIQQRGLVCSHFTVCFLGFLINCIPPSYLLLLPWLSVKWNIETGHSFNRYKCFFQASGTVDQRNSWWVLELPSLICLLLNGHMFPFNNWDTMENINVRLLWIITPFFTFMRHL